MRIGLFSLWFFMSLFFLILVNYSGVSSTQIDVVFQGVDANVLDMNFSTDANINNFVTYTVRGILQELHGTYYLAAWANTWLPAWLTQNKDLLVAVTILVVASPIIAVVLHFVLLILFAIFLWYYDKVKEHRKKPKS
jgi:maltodextrin utilization protein YvdJ